MSNETRSARKERKTLDREELVASLREAGFKSVGGHRYLMLEAARHLAAPSHVGQREEALADALRLVLDDWANANTIGLDAQDRADAALSMPKAPRANVAAPQTPEPVRAGADARVQSPGNGEPLSQTNRTATSAAAAAPSSTAASKPTAWLCKNNELGYIDFTSDAELADVRLTCGKWTVTPLYAFAPSASEPRMSGGGGSSN